jgi:hypothetical protein
MEWEQIVANPWIGFAGTLFGVIGISVSIFIYFRTRRYRKPTYSKRSIRWYDGAVVPHDDIKLTFRGKIIDRFVITHLAFWNAGNQPIREADFARASPLRIVLPDDTEVFDLRITAITAQEIQAGLESPSAIEPGTKKEIPVRFDYLDRGDGFVIQVVHNSKSDKGIEVRGKLPGVSRFYSGASYSLDELFFPRNARASKITTMPIWARRAMLALAFLSLGGLGLWSIYWALFREFHWYQIFGAIFVIYLVLPFALLSEEVPPKALADALENNERRAVELSGRGYRRAR